MADKFREIDGVGSARNEKLQEAGYESYSDLAEANASELSQEISRLSEDKALEIIVQAQNLNNLQNAETENNPTVQDEQSGEIDKPGEDDKDLTYTVVINIVTDRQYDSLYDALLAKRQSLLGKNKRGVKRVSEYIDELRVLSVGDELVLEMTPTQLNKFHSVVSQHRLYYQGKNLSEQLEAIRAIEDQINTIREEHIL